MGTIASTGQQFAVVADQKLDQVSLYYRVPDSDQFSSPVPIDGTTQLPLLAPGAVQTFYVPNDPNPYLVVANSLSNNVLVYHYDPLSTHFVLLESIQAGDDPVSVTVADVNGDHIPDLLVANRGSNDVSVLIGSTATGSWTATPYQRLNSGGSGPVAVTAIDLNSPHGPDLLVTNSNGNVAVMTGIGSGGKGSGFFQDINPPEIAVDSPIMTAPEFVDANTALAIAADGRIVALNLNTLTADFVFQADDGLGVNALDVMPDGAVVAALSNGAIAELVGDAAGQFHMVNDFAPLPGLNDPSALQAFDSGSGLLVLLTNAGSSQLFVFAMLPTGPTLTVTPSQDASLTLIVTLLFSGESTETSTSNTIGVGSESAIADGIIPASFRAATVFGSGADDAANPTPERPEDRPSTPGIDLDEKLRRFDPYPSTQDANPDDESLRRVGSIVPLSAATLAEQQAITDELFGSWDGEPMKASAPLSFEVSASQPSAAWIASDTWCAGDSCPTSRPAARDDRPTSPEATTIEQPVQMISISEEEEQAGQPPSCRLDSDLDQAALATLAVVGVFIRPQPREEPAERGPR